jgi:hypothetical protein
VCPNTGWMALIAYPQSHRGGIRVRLEVVKKRGLAWRVTVLALATAAGVVIGLSIVPWSAGGKPEATSSMVGGPFPSWLWPTMTITILSLIWVFLARRLVIKPMRDRRSYRRTSHHESGPTGTGTELAEGWYEDPYRVHEYRWFSVGKPSSLVRDGLTESNDLPPDEPYAGVLVPESGGANSGATGADFRRAGDGLKPDNWDVAVDASTWFPTN